MDHCFFFFLFSHIKFIVTEEWLMYLKLVKWTKNWSKQAFLEFIEKFAHDFLGVGQQLLLPFVFHWPWGERVDMHSVWHECQLVLTRAR